MNDIFFGILAVFLIIFLAIIPSFFRRKSAQELLLEVANSGRGNDARNRSNISNADINRLVLLLQQVFIGLRKEPLGRLHNMLYSDSAIFEIACHRLATTDYLLFACSPNKRIAAFNILSKEIDGRFNNFSHGKLSPDAFAEILNDRLNEYAQHLNAGEPANSILNTLPRLILDSSKRGFPETSRDSPPEFHDPLEILELGRILAEMEKSAIARIKAAVLNLDRQ